MAADARKPAGFKTARKPRAAAAAAPVDLRAIEARERRVQLVLLALISLLCLNAWLPFRVELPASDLDLSWVLVLHDSFARAIDFGRDIAFTFGPWGFLYQGTIPQTIVWTMVGRGFLALSFAVGIWGLARRAFPRAAQSALWSVVVLLISGSAINQMKDVRLFSFAWLLLCLDIAEDDRSLRWISVVLAVAMSLASLVKFSAFMLCVAVIVVVTLNDVLRRKRWPLPGVAYCVGILAMWLLARQPLSGIAPFFRHALAIAGGYSEAMSVTGPNEAAHIFFFVACAILLLAIVAVPLIRRSGGWALLPLAGLAASIFLPFKAGYVRNAGHEVTAVASLLLISLFFSASVWPWIQRRQMKVAALIAVLLSLGLTWIGYDANSLTEADPRSTGSLATHAADCFSGFFSNLSTLMAMVGAHSPLASRDRAELARIHERFPVPPLAGTCDVYPWNQAALIAHGLPRATRPVMGSYSAYTPGLAQLNADFLATDRAPGSILFDVFTIDRRYPSLDDGLSWPLLLTQYRIAGGSGRSLILQQQTRRPGFSLLPLGQKTVKFGEAIDVPSSGPDPIWAAIRVRPTIAGTAAKLLYKPPELVMDVHLRGGQHAPFRFIPGMASSGFLLSPFVDSAGAWAALKSDHWETSLKDRAVVQIGLFASDGSIPTFWYKPDVDVYFFGLRFEHQDVFPVTRTAQ